MTASYLEAAGESRHIAMPDCPQRVRDIIDEVMAQHGVGVREFYAPYGRTRRVARCRWDAAWRLRHAPVPATGRPPSLPQIGRWLRLNHTSVLHALRRWPEVRDEFAA